MRAVLDTNQHVSAAIKAEGHPGQIIQAWQRGEFDLVISESILAEIEEVLHRPHIYEKYHLTEARISQIIYTLRRYAIVVAGEVKVEIIKADPRDDHILACAIEGETDFIVSGDPHLKNLRSHQGIQIVSPKEFLEIL